MRNVKVLEVSEFSQIYSQMVVLKFKRVENYRDLLENSIQV